MLRKAKRAGERVIVNACTLTLTLTLSRKGRGDYLSISDGSELVCRPLPERWDANAMLASYRPVWSGPIMSFPLPFVRGGGGWGRSIYLP